MRKTEKKRTFRNLQTRIYLLFIILAAFLAGLVAIYWTIELEPRIGVEAEARARALAHTKIPSLADALTFPESTAKAAKITGVMKEILLLKTPNTESLIIVGIELDHKTRDAPKAEFYRKWGNTDCAACFVTEVPLWSGLTGERVGVVKLHCSGDFLLRLKKEAGTRLFYGAGIIIALLTLAWWIVAILLRPLDMLAAALRKHEIGRTLALPNLSGSASEEIHVVKTAVDDLLKKIVEHTEELANAKDYADSIIASIQDVLLVLDIDGTIRSLNRTARIVLGYTDEELAGRHVDTIVAKTGKNPEWEKFVEIIGNETCANLEIDFLTMDGRKIPVSITGSAITDKAGGFSKVLLVARDMREILSLIAELRASRNYSESIVRAIPSGLAVIGDDGRILSANPCFQKLFGNGNPVGKDIVDVAPFAEIRSLIRKVIYEGEDACDLEIVLDTNGNENSPVALNTSIVNLAANKKNGELDPWHLKPNEQQAKMLVVFNDITEQKRLMVEMADIVGELRRTQAQLVQSGKMSAVGELAAGVAHEMNNPLTGVLVYSDLMKQKIDGYPGEIGPNFKEFPKQLNIITAAAKRCKAISDNLLTFARQNDSQLSKTDLAEVIEKTFGLINTQLRHKRINVVKNVPERAIVCGNAGQLQQVFTNIILNAVQSMEKDGELALNVKPGDSICEIAITDTGAGIPNENLDRIFEPFFTTKPIGKGTGLGLSIVYGIIQNHGGEITVDSAVGEGTTFTVRLRVNGPNK